MQLRRMEVGRDGFRVISCISRDMILGVDSRKLMMIWRMEMIMRWTRRMMGWTRVSCGSSR